jgi:Holliday junction resolvase|tara:strand:+ start:936 stop:1334 length:399 start_codon:yes stop_codon:yes gene_type:complete
MPMKPERKLWHELKKSTPQISWTRIENSGSFGTPDLLGYNTRSVFFTVELKATKTNKVRFSPHQFAFHVKHPDNTFILVKALSLNLVKLYKGKDIMELDACGLKLEACASGLEACVLHLDQLGSYRRDSLFP